MRSGCTRYIAIILEDISNPYFGIMVKYLDQRIQKKGFCSILYTTDGQPEKEESAIQAAIATHVAGAVVFPTSRNANALRLFQHNSIPFVLIDRYYDDAPDMNYIISNNIKGGYLATKYLIEKGHRDILLFRGPSYISSAMERYQGYVQALTQYNIPLQEQLLMQCGVWNISSKEALEKVIREGIHFTAVVTFSDKQAWMAQKFLAEIGGESYSHVDIVGFDNLRNELYYSADLPSIDTNKEYVAKRTIQVLFQHIYDPDSEYAHETVDVRLVLTC
ncbi:MAG: substrate-binding domain-containing protein [Clostridia bacterium]